MAAARFRTSHSGTQSIVNMALRRDWICVNWEQPRRHDMQPVYTRRTALGLAVPQFVPAKELQSTRGRRAMAMCKRNNKDGMAWKYVRLGPGFWLASKPRFTRVPNAEIMCREAA